MGRGATSVEGVAGGQRATIEDVSRAAGVSIKTVSRVLNKERYVAAATREKVEVAARALAGHRSFQIALIYDNPSPYYAQNIQNGVREHCAAHGYRMIAQPCDSEKPGLLEEVGSLIDQAQLDGVILTPPFTEHLPLRDALAARRIPYVTVSPASVDSAISSVTIDQRAAAAAMVRHLVALGHRRIGFVAGAARFATSARRIEGYRDALAEAGIAYDAGLVQPGEYDFASGTRAGLSLMMLPSPPTAIFASSDDMAAGVLAAAHRIGISVPGQLSVAGFDDTDLASVVWPPLTTIRQPVRALGAAAAELLLALPDRVEQRVLDFDLVSRDSVAVAV
jgi:LacI family transcriptional regulator